MEAGVATHVWENFRHCRADRILKSPPQPDERSCHYQSYSQYDGVPNSNVESFPGFDDKPLTKEDFKAVRELIGEVVRDEHALAMARSIVAWLTAFRIFKKLERKIGLPMSADSKLVYGGIVAQLKGTGKWILIASGNNPKVLEYLDIHYDDLASRVKELSWDDDWVENPISASEKSQLSAAFGG